MSYKPEVQTDDTGAWYGNALRFATEAEALESGRDLMGHWMLVRDYRATQCSDPVTWSIVNGELRPVGELPEIEATAGVMRTISVKLYQFDELPDDKARERARQWWRDTSAGDNHFAEFTLSDAREWLTACGFSDVDFRWSGFWSQGDGASFLGTWAASKRDAAALAKLREDRPAVCASNTAWHAIAARFDKVAAGLPTLRATLKDNGCHSVHQHSVAIDIEESDDGEALQGNALELWQEFRDTCRYAMRQIYRELESAYEWENADEQIDDALRANEYEFTAEGKIHG